MLNSYSLLLLNVKIVLDRQDLELSLCLYFELMELAVLEQLSCSRLTIFLVFAIM